MEKCVIFRGALEERPHSHLLLVLSHQKSCHLQLLPAPYSASQREGSGPDTSIMLFLHLQGEKDSNFLLWTQRTLRNHVLSCLGPDYVVLAQWYENHCSPSPPCPLPSCPSDTEQTTTISNMWAIISLF